MFILDWALSYPWPRQKEFGGPKMFESSLWEESRMERVRGRKLEENGHAVTPLEITNDMRAAIS